MCNINLIILFCLAAASDAEMKLLTAHNKQEFKDLLYELPDLARELKSPDKANDALFIYLMRIRTGRTYEEIATHFGISVNTVQRRCDTVRDIMKKVIVPRYINYEMSRTELLSHKSQTAYSLTTTIMQTVYI